LQWSLEIAPSRVLGRNNKGSCAVNFFAAPKGERSHALTAGEGRCRLVPVGEPPSSRPARVLARPSRLRNRHSYN
jgi:hypothetical protein